ncbi:DUF1311 domain-containing protein [Ruegeria sp. NA]|nr:lysozyme inhibitor LprI family protein [Ruegeria sp. NA]MCX8951850.1 DUF1311 domain-containing protein [Ruegeria sp. NA]
MSRFNSSNMLRIVSGFSLTVSLTFSGGKAAVGDSENLIFLPYDAMKQDVVSCMENEDFLGEPESCARVSFETCMKDWQVPASRSKAASCNHHEYLIWREQYQEVLLNMLYTAQSTDRDAATDASPNIDAFAQIMSIESQWQQLRESECRYAMSLAAGGTAGNTIYPVCLAEFTAQRIALLNARRRK